METEERSLLEKLAAADAAKLRRWTADRFLHAGRWLWWHAARLRMQLIDALEIGGPLPPGSLAASCSQAVTEDDQFYFRQLRRHGPIFKLFWGSRRLKICVVGFPLGRRLVNEHRGSMHPATTDISPLVPAEYLRTMDPAIHPHYRRVFKSALHDELVMALEPDIRRIIRVALEALASRAPAERPTGAQLYRALDVIAMRTLLLVVLGVRPEATMRPDLEAGYHRLGPRGHLEAVGPEQQAAYPVILERVRQILDALRRGEQAGFSDSIIGRIFRTSPSAVDDTVIGNAIYMVERGRHDLRDALRWTVKYLSDNPSVVEELRGGATDPAARMSLAEACVMETLRLDQAESINRKTTAPFTFEGYQIPEGSGFAILMRESHRDPANFTDPEKFCPARFLKNAYSADQYAPFGIDEHQCIGRFLAVRLGTMFIEELVGGYRWTVASDGPRHYGAFHWQPSNSFAIDLRRAAPGGG